MHGTEAPAARHVSASDASPAGNRGQVIVVTGPTSVGKTEASLLLAERLDGEVISADSVQVYRGLDVGSDKLPVEQRRGALAYQLPLYQAFCSLMLARHLL